MLSKQVITGLSIIVPCQDTLSGEPPLLGFV